MSYILKIEEQIGCLVCLILGLFGIKTTITFDNYIFLNLFRLILSHPYCISVIMIADKLQFS